MIRGCFLTKRKRILGFSIVEMSVVLASVAAVIVLTAGGVTMVNKAKLGKITSDIAHFRNAIEKFEKKHGSLPGDMADTSSLSGNPTGGDGNGAIDSPAEALYLWQHLSAAEILDGQYDGASTFVPGLGVPASDIDSSGYNIKFPLPTFLPEQALVIEVAGFSVGPNSNSMPILTAEDARAIDEKADDGNPLTGEIFAEEATVGACINGGEYNVSNEAAACRLLFVIKSGKSAQDADDVTGECNELGQSRQENDPTQRCPVGYVGKVVETCRIDSGDVGQWQITDKKCALIECSEGGFYGDERRLSCINNMVPTTGKGILQECTEAGIWKVTDTDCEVETQISCKTNGNLRVAQACDWGEEGYNLQTCTDNVWGTPTSDICTKIQCSGPTRDIGDSEDFSGCGDSDYTGDARRVCTINKTWEPTSVGSTCVPTYSGGCTAGTTADKEIGCPVGKSGEHWLTCVDSDTTDYWTTLRDTCEPITCDGGENIGTVRVKEGAICDNGLNGTVMEYCKDDGAGNGVWQEVTTNCVANLCDSTGDLVGSAYWPATVANGTGTATACAEGYEWSTAPTRQCDATGTWAASPTGECDRIRCDELTPDHNNATYTAPVYAGNYDLKGTCKSGFVGDPIIDCSLDGEWVNERLPCEPDLPMGAILWLDADDSSTVHSSSSCVGSIVYTPAFSDDDRVGCWEDKSDLLGGTGTMDATQTSANAKPNYFSGGPNGNSYVTFNYEGGGNNDCMQNLDLETVDDTLSIFVAATYFDTTDTIIMNPGHFFVNVKNGRFNSFYSSGSYNLHSNHGADSALVAGTFYALTTVMDGSNDSPYINGVDVGQRPDSLNPFSDGYRVGQNGCGAGNHDYHGSIGEIFIYDDDVTTADREQVENYLGDKWNITITH